MTGEALVVDVAPTRVLLESGAPGGEEILISVEAYRRRIPVLFVAHKLTLRRTLPIDESMLPVGTVRFIRAALAQLGREMPPENSYPVALQPYLRRRVWRSTLGGAQSEIERRSGAIFVKPADRVKRFSGLVLHDRYDLARYGIRSLRTPVWCSDVVSWASQWRAFVSNSFIVGLEFVSGDRSRVIDPATLKNAVHDFMSAGEAPVAYALDFGVLASGETALIDFNDGFALGTSTLAGKLYFDLLWRRWREILRG